MKKSRLLDTVYACIFSIVSFWISNATATTIIAPNASHEVYNCIPLGECFDPGRYQQVYNASIFGTGPVSIQSLAFSPNHTGTFSADIDIRMTTTTTAVGNLSTILDDNFTIPLTTVLSDSSFSQAMSSSGPESFSLLFDISDFQYDPSAGNLLLDIAISGISNVASFSRAGVTGESSRAFNSTGVVGGTDGYALRSRISFAPVPIPPSVWLFGSGLLGLVGIARRKAETAKGDRAG